MRKIVKLLIPALLACCTGAIAQTEPASVPYDSTLAEQLGADDYGMKMYVLAVLKTGPVQETDRAVMDSLFSGHMANINRLADEGKLIVAGPLVKNELSYRGIFIFDVRTIPEAEELVATDPAVAHGVFEVEYFNWYGSAALPLYLESAKKIVKKKL